MLVLAPVVAFLFGVSIAPADAIEVHPDAAQITAALERGKAMAKARASPDALYAWFGGPDDTHPKGFFVTKLGSLAVMATHFALRAEEPEESDIAQVLKSDSFLVSVFIFGDRPDFAVNSYMILEQHGRSVMPVNVRFDGRAARSPAWPDAPRFRAKVVATFGYADVDPTAKTKLSVFPSTGGEVSFDLDLADIE